MLLIDRALKILLVFVPGAYDGAEPPQVKVREWRNAGEKHE